MFGKDIGCDRMQEIVTLQVTIEYSGNLKAAKEELNRAVQKCNCLCSSYHKDDSFGYKVVSSEVD